MPLFAAWTPQKSGLNLPPTMRVDDLMTHDPECVNPDDDLATAANVMWDLDCGCVPVVGDGHRIVGMITDRDLCMAALLNGRPLHELRVAAVMAKEVATVKNTDTLEQAQIVMRTKHVRRIPVVDQEHRVVGILSLHDLAQAAIRERRRFFPRVRLRDVAATFAEISKPSTKPALPASSTTVAYAE